jgi:hypothetical protein
MCLTPFWNEEKRPLMKRFYSISILLILFSLLLTGYPNDLLARSIQKNDRKGELNTRENLPEKYSTPTEAVKTFFTALKDKDFDLAWESLSTVSQNQFIQSLAASQKISPAQARELLDKNKESVRVSFWAPLRERSKIVPLVPNAVYTLTDEKDNQAMVEMKSGGISNHIKAIKEGKEWRMGYVESALQENQPSPRTTPPESAPKASTP